MRLLLIVPDGVAVRNYLYSEFINELQAKGVEVMLYQQISNAALEEIKKVHPKLSEIKSIPYFIEKPVARLLRESLAYARLLYNSKKLKNPTIMGFWNRNQKSLKQKLLYRLAEVLGTVFSWNYKLILKMEKLYDREISQDAILKKMDEDFRQFNPDSILNLHQRSPLCAPIVLAAKKRNIPISTVIFSWDNVPKARLISRYNTYLVWSEIMKDELSQLYPEINKESIQIVGTPQFEFYFDEKFLKSKEDFFTEFGLDLNKKTVCFSGNDLSSPYEANYFEDICEAISKIEEKERPQVLFRRCPVDKSNRFDSVLQKYDEFVFSVDPDWRNEDELVGSFATIYPAYQDIALLVNTVKHCDVVINLGSTMVFDFAIFNKPCLYLNYNPVVNSVFKVEMSYEFQHFKSMQGLNPVGWINSKEQIVDSIKEALLKPDEVVKDKQLWFQKVVHHPLDQASNRIATQLTQSL